MESQSQGSCVEYTSLLVSKYRNLLISYLRLLLLARINRVEEKIWESGRMFPTSDYGVLKGHGLECDTFRSTCQPMVSEFESRTHNFTHALVEE